MSAREHIHLKAIRKQRRGNYTYESAYCNKSWTGMSKVGLKAFMAVMEIEPEVLCTRCMNKAKKKGFFEDPEQYELEYGMMLLATLNQE